MKMLTLYLLAAVALATAAHAQEAPYVYVGNVKIIYVRGSGVPTAVDEIEKREKPRNRIGAGLLLVGVMEPVAPMPHPKRRR